MIYVDKSSQEIPELRARFLMNGRVLATQKSLLPAPDESGAVPMAIRAIAKPGDYEVRITIEQGHAAIQGNLKYSIAAK